MTPRPAVPGSGLTYQGLLDADAATRETWYALLRLAEIRGVATSAPNGPTRRTKTVDEVLVDLHAALPAHVDPMAAAEATRLLFTDVSERQTAYEVRHLLAVGDRVEWAVTTSFEDRSLAEAERDYWAAQTGEVYLVVEVATTVRREPLR